MSAQAIVTVERDIAAPCERVFDAWLDPDLASQFLFGYMLNPWTSLFAGYTDNYLGTGDTGLVQQGRTYFLKVSYAFQL